VEDWDLVFADDEREANPTSFKFLQMAHAWKARSIAAGNGGRTSGILSGFVTATLSSKVERENRRAHDDDDEDDDDDDDEEEEEEEEEKVEVDSDAASSRADDD